SRPRRITANPYDQVRSKAPDHRPGACEAGRKSGQRPGPFRDRYALERPHSNELQAEALAGDDPRFQPASSSDEADFNFRVPPLELTRDRQAGENMAPRAARRNQDLQRQLSPPYCAMTVGAPLRGRAALSSTQLSRRRNMRSSRSKILNASFHLHASTRSAASRLQAGSLPETSRRSLS